MPKLLLRADDLGYSKAVNLGIIETVKAGLIKSVGVMVNMPATQDGVDRIKDFDVALGLHTNICVEKPLVDSGLVPSLVDASGFFKSSKVYRSTQEDFVDFDQVVLEIEAQYQRFLDLFGRKPDYFEGHAVASANFFRGLEYVADKYDLKYSGMSFGGQPIQIGQSLVQFHMASMAPNYDPRAMIEAMVKAPSEADVELAVCHPGYLDHYIMTHSSLLEARTLEVEALTDTGLANWLRHSQVDLVDYMLL